jgi:competence protein ComEC
MLGGYHGIKREVVKDFTATGLVHILSVSGAHIALVAGAILWLGGRLRLKRELLALTAAGAVTAYALLAGLTPPVVRALIMGIIALAAVGLGREKDTPQALALAALLMLAHQPGLLYDVSFQLSFSATTGLVLLYRRTAERLGFLPKWLAGALAATIAAQLGALPFMAWYFNAISLSSLLAGILIIPFVEIILIAGILAGIAGLAAPLLGKLLLVLCAQLIGVAVSLTAVLAALPGSLIHMPAMGVATGVIYYLMIAWIYGYSPAGLPGPAAVARRWPQVAVGALALITVATAALSWTPRPVQVHFIDVGQGDATLITTPYGRSVLIDTGGSGQQAEYDIGERVVVPYLKHYGITAVDYLVLTHGHADHAGGAAGVASALPVKNIILPPDEVTPAIQALRRAAAGQPVALAYTGQTFNLDGVAFSMLHTGGTDREETSGVVRVDYGRHSFLITGDLGSGGEQLLLARRLAPGSVLKVAHHGSKHSTTKDFLKVYSPDFAVISAGYNNRFGHPHSETLIRLAERNIQVYRTDRHGAIVFSTDGDTLAVKTHKNSD